MKVYGFSDVDALRGELRGADIDSELLHYDGEAENILGWDYLSPKFAEAKKALIEKMTEDEVDQDMIDLVKTMKASFIPLETLD